LSSGLDVRGGEYVNGIGVLVENGTWRKVLPLSQEQAEAISKLDDVVWDTYPSSSQKLAVLDSVDGNLKEYRKRTARMSARHSQTVEHAQRMVKLGLLTAPQAALVVQQRLTRYPTISLSDEFVQELLGLTKNQQAELTQVWAEAKSRKARLNLMAVDPQELQENSDSLQKIEQWTDAAVLAIRTPKQREKWNQLTARRTLPAEPPDLPVPTEAEIAQIKLEKMSPIFRAVAENMDTLGLSGEQKKLLTDLQDVTRLGLFWISHRDGKAPFPPGIDGGGQADPVAQTRDEFLKHAGQVALLGILTQQQAAKIAKAVKQN